MPQITTRDRTTIHFDDWGAGAPIVFTHGWALGAAMWEYQAAPLARAGLRCVAIDRRGCGRSDRPGGGYDFDTFADDLAAVLDHLDLRDATLVGHSFGGAEVARYLARHGAGRVARVALVAPITPCIGKRDDNPDGVDPAAFQWMIGMLEQDRPKYLAGAVRDFFGADLPGVEVSPEMMQWGVGLALSASPLATIEMVRAMSGTDLRPDMAAFTVPTLILHGDADTTAPLELCGRRTAQAIPGSRLEVYAGHAHGLFVTARERLNRDLLTFARG